MQDFTGELAAVGTSLCFAFGSILFTFAGREIGAQPVNRIRLLMAACIVGAIHWLTFGQWFPVNASAQELTWLGLSGIVGLVLGDICLMQAFVLIGPRLSMLMMALAPVFSTIIAWLFLHETLDTQTSLGIVLAIIGVVVVVTERSNGGSASVAARGKAYKIGLLLALGGSLGQAGGTVLSRLGVAGGIDPISASLIRLVVATGVIWLIALLRRQARETLAAVQAKPRAGLGVLGGVVMGPVLGVWLSLVAVQRTSVGIASTLTSLTPIFLIPISYVVFKERITRQAVFGTLIAFAGTVLLFI